VEGYEINVAKHLLPTLGRTRLARLTPAAVQVLLNRKVEAGLSPSTVRGIHATLRSALGQAERWGLVPRNVAKLVSPPRVTRPEVQPFTSQEARRFLDAVKGDRFEVLYQVSLALGLRQGETLGLRWEDVDLDRGSLTVMHSLQRHDGEYRLVEPKTQRSRRTVGLPPQLVKTLRRHRTLQREARLKAGPQWRGDEWGLVFCREDGEPLSSAVVTHRFQDTLSEAKLPRQRFHDLRHAAASFMLAEGVSLRVVMEVLGHSEIGTTANIYGHVMPELSKDATDRVGKLLWAGA
jgi:integrase